MALRRVQVTDFRCLHQGDLELDPHFTLIRGPNASGKTSVLEAIYLLGRGRSFRTRRLEQVIRSGASALVVFGMADGGTRRINMGVEVSPGGIRARIDGERVRSLAELATVLPVQIIDPEVHRLIEEGPSRRRRFLDWGVFHVEPAFVDYWQSYHQVLRQRNAALRAGQPRLVVEAWDSELTRYAGLVSEARARYIESLGPVVADVAARLLGLELTLGYRPGWAKDLEFSQALARSWPHDHEMGATQVGPQRAELTIKLNGVPARDRISRGQQKLLAAVLLISQIKLFRDDADVRPTLLLDDPAAELDVERLTAFINEVRAQPLQLVVTTLSKGPAEFEALGAPGKQYRLEAGAILSE
jgi:DNA replication and repair protein RecF